MTQPIPNASVSPIDQRTGRFTAEWYRFFKFGAAEAATAEATEYRLLGSSTIKVAGLLQDGLAVVSLHQLADSGTGASLWKFTRDAWGRVSGTEAATAADLPYDNATSGLGATDVQAAVDELAASSSGGILPMVNGDVPPTLMYFDDGSLLYAQVE